MKKEIKQASIPTPVKEWFSEREASTYTGMSVEALKKMRYAGKVRYGIKSDGRSVTYRRIDLDKAMEANYTFYDALPVDPNANILKTRIR